MSSLASCVMSGPERVISDVMCHVRCRVCVVAVGGGVSSASDRHDASVQSPCHRRLHGHERHLPVCTSTNTVTLLCSVYLLNGKHFLKHIFALHVEWPYEAPGVMIGLLSVVKLDSSVRTRGGTIHRCIDISRYFSCDMYRDIIFYNHNFYFYFFLATMIFI